jgi:WD40 repeat protein/serine/threonine protein kinase
MQIGEILNGTYQIERPLGVGGQARVWQARHLRLPRRFAIKECPLGGNDPREVDERRTLFERERDILAALSHPGHPAIPKISDFWEEPDCLFIVLDLVEGETLIELLARRGRLTMSEAINWGKQICDVLTYLHGWMPPIIYRDLSPDNVILDRSGQLHLIDFGIARTFKPGQPQNTTALGKAGYASPEHLEGGKAQTDVRSDIYTLGALLFHLLTGQEPVPVVDRLKHRAGLQGGRLLVAPRTLNTHLTPAMESCILCAMELEPARRFQNAAEMSRALDACGVHAPQASLPAPNEINPQRMRTRPFDPTTAWGAANAPTATPPSLPHHPRSASPWPQDQPTLTNQPIPRSPGRGTGDVPPGALTPRSPTSGPQVNSSLPSPMSGNLGPSPLGRITTGPAGASPASSGPLPAQPASPGQPAYPDPSGRGMRVGRFGQTGPQSTPTPSHTLSDLSIAQPKGVPVPGHILPDLPVAPSRALVRVSTKLPRAPVQRGPLLSRRRVLIGLGVVGLAAAGGGIATVLFKHSVTPYTVLYTLTDDSLPVQCVAWSPDSQRLAGGGKNTLIKIWERASGRVTITLSGHSDFVQGVAWANDGIHLASASADKSIKIWDALQGGQPQQTLLGHTDTVYSVAWSPDGSMLVSGSADKNVLIWDALNGGQPKLTLAGHTDAVYSVAWSPDGKLIASASNDGSTRIWDAHTGNLMQHPLDNSTGFVRGVAWSPNSQQVASAAQNETVTVWNVNAAYPPALTLSGPKGVLTSVSWSHDGGLLAAGSADHTIAIWDAHQGAPALNTLSGHSDVVTSVAWTPDNMLLASASNDNTIIVWQRQS